MREVPSKKKRRRVKANKGLIVFELVLLVIILLVVFKGDALLLYGKKMLKLEKLTLVPITQMPYTGRNTLLQSSVFKAKDKVIICEDIKLKVYSSEGLLEYQGDLNANATLVEAGNAFYVVAESSRGELVTVDYKGTILKRITNLGALRQVSVFDDAAILIQLQDKKTIQLLSSNLESMMTAVVPSGEILGAKVFMDAKTIAVAAIETTGNTLGTAIYQYSFEGKLLGITNFDSEIVYDLFSDSKLHVLTDTGFYTLTPDGVVIQKDVYTGLMHSYTVLKEGVLLLTEALIEDVVEDVKAFNYQTYDWNTYVLKAIPVDSSYTSLLKGETYLLGISESTLELYDLSYALKVSLPNDTLYTNGFWLSKTRLLLYNDITADIFEVKQK